MASTFQYLSDAETLIWEVARRVNEAEITGRYEFMAARTIQRRFRGYLERRHLARLHAAAITIQRHWRGFIGRRLYMAKLKTVVDIMVDQFYNAMATILQRNWRGCLVRRKIHNHRAFKCWRQGISQKNKELQITGRIFGKGHVKMAELESESRAKTNVLFILFKLHHMLRTEVTPGAFSLLDSSQLSILEEQLSEMHLTEFVDELHKYRAMKMEKTEERSVNVLPTFFKHRECEQFWWDRQRVNADTASMFANGPHGDCRRVPVRPRCLLDAAVCMPHRYEWVRWHSPCPCVLQERKTPHNLYREMPKPPMVFIRTPPEHVPRLDHDDPHTLPRFVPRESNSALNIGKHKFLTVYKSKELSETYTKCKHGPYIPNMTAPSLIRMRYEEECEKKSKQNKDYQYTSKKNL